VTSRLRPFKYVHTYNPWSATHIFCRFNCNSLALQVAICSASDPREPLEGRGRNFGLNFCSVESPKNMRSGLYGEYGRSAAKIRPRSTHTAYHSPPPPTLRATLSRGRSQVCHQPLRLHATRCTARATACNPFLLVPATSAKRSLQARSLSAGTRGMDVSAVAPCSVPATRDSTAIDGVRFRRALRCELVRG
jgi:hypothetical protein